MYIYYIYILYRKMWSTFQTHRLFLRFEELTIYSSKVMVRDDRVA